MPISSLIVQTEPDKTDDVALAIRAFSLADVSRIVDEKIIVITETSNTDEDRDVWEDIKKLQGVLALDLIYHNFEDMEEWNEQA